MDYIIFVDFRVMDKNEDIEYLDDDTNASDFSAETLYYGTRKREISVILFTTFIHCYFIVCIVHFIFIVDYNS
jgi:hypothetical protein